MSSLQTFLQNSSLLWTLDHDIHLTVSKTEVGRWRSQFKITRSWVHPQDTTFDERQPQQNCCWERTLLNTILGLVINFGTFSFKLFLPLDGRRWPGTTFRAGGLEWQVGGKSLTRSQALETYLIHWRLFTVIIIVIIVTLCISFSCQILITDHEINKQLQVGSTCDMHIYQTFPWSWPFTKIILLDISILLMIEGYTVFECFF